MGFMHENTYINFWFSAQFVDTALEIVFRIWCFDSSFSFLMQVTVTEFTTCHRYRPDSVCHSATKWCFWVTRTHVTCSSRTIKDNTLSPSPPLRVLVGLCLLRRFSFLSYMKLCREFFTQCLSIWLTSTRKASLLPFKIIIVRPLLSACPEKALCQFFVALLYILHPFAICNAYISILLYIRNVHGIVKIDLNL